MRKDCPLCGSTRIQVDDREPLVDCLGCGIWFHIDCTCYDGIQCELCSIQVNKELGLEGA